MSYCLIKKGIDLIEQDLVSSDSSLKYDKNKIEQSSKGLQKFKNQNVKKKSGNFSQRKVKNSLQAYKIKIIEDQTKNNIKYLQNIDYELNSNEDAQKIKQLHLCKINKERKAHKAKKRKIPKSVFTEEDFERMNDKWLSLK